VCVALQLEERCIRLNSGYKPCSFGEFLSAPIHPPPLVACPVLQRGILNSLKEFFTVLEMLLGYIAGNLYVEVVSGWRYMYATSTPLCLIMGVGMCWLPSSPRWLLLCAIQGKGNLPETWPSPLLRSHSTFETVGEFFRRNHPDHYLGQQPVYNTNW